MNGLLVLAVDGLDWPLLLALHDAGRMPNLRKLLARGAQVRLALPPHTAGSAAARWVSIACGAGPAHHGIAHDQVCRPDGLRLEPPRADDVYAQPLWQRAWQAGLGACVAGWPATAGTCIPSGAGAGSTCVADGFQQPQAGVQRAWPLSPDCVAPTADRALVRAARMHPAEVGDDLLAALLPAPVAAAPAALREAAAQLLAQWASAHNLGVHWCEQGRAPLVMLRLGGLPAWRQVASACGAPGPDSEHPWLAWLDLLLGRYAELLGVHGHLMLLSDQGREDTSDGGMLLSGPEGGVPHALAQRPATLPATLCLHVALRLLGMHSVPPQPTPVLGCDPDPALHLIDTLRAAPVCDDAALRWLSAQGVASADLGALRQRARSVRELTLARLGAAS